MVLRLLALVFIAELSGAAHAAIDVAASAGLVEHPDDGCDDDEAGHECPPGCLGCHGAHGAVTMSAPRIELRLAVLSVPARARVPARAPVLPPSSAPRPPLYRPPKASALSQAML